MGTVPTRRARVPHTTQVLTAGVSPTAKQISPLPWQPGINAGCPSFVHRTPVHKQNDTLLHRTLRCWVGRASACRSGFRATPGDFVASLPHNFSPPQAGRSGRPMTVHRRPDAAGASRQVGGQVGGGKSGQYTQTQFNGGQGGTSSRSSRREAVAGEAASGSLLANWVNPLRQIS